MEGIYRSVWVRLKVKVLSVSGGVLGRGEKLSSVFKSKCMIWLIGMLSGMF